MEAHPQNNDVETPHWALSHVDDFGFAIYPLGAWLRMRSVPDIASSENEEVS